MLNILVGFKMKRKQNWLIDWVTEWVSEWKKLMKTGYWIATRVILTLIIYPYMVMSVLLLSYHILYMLIYRVLKKSGEKPFEHPVCSNISNSAFRESDD